MLSVFPKSIANKAIAAYLVGLAVSTILYSKYSMRFEFIAFGIMEVLLFFIGSSYLTVRWSKLSDRTFEKNLFWYAFALRSVWVVFSFFYFSAQTGQPFEYGAADSYGYHEMAGWLSGCDWNFTIKNLFNSGDGISDSGYVFYLSSFYRLFGVNIFIARVAKCLYSSFICVLMYRLATRNFGKKTGRMTGLFCMLMPNLIWYCGLHLKEIEMVLLTVLCVERADYAFRAIGKQQIVAFLVSGLSALLLFGFRTALAGVLIIAIGCAILFSSREVLSKWQKWMFGSVLAIGLLFTMGNQIRMEVEEIWEEKDTKQEENMAWRAVRENGNSFAAYAGKAVFAPLIFTIPFPTVIRVEGQEVQQMINGGNFVKNITSFFTIMALVFLLLTGKWRRHVLPIAFLCGYLFVITMSQYAQSERFHMPALPFALMFAAYGVTHINILSVKLFKYWPYIMCAAMIGWSWFKLAGRGLV